jgi:hypothetical protein
LADGYGVFKADKWVHCGNFKNSSFQEGRKVSVHKEDAVLVLIDQKCLADGSVLKKIERFSKQGLVRIFSKNGQEVTAIIPRLIKKNHAQNWLSMQPNPLRYSNTFGSTFGELIEKNKPSYGREIRVELHGRAILIDDDGFI